MEWDFKPEKQQLVNSSENDFPYNILISFPSTYPDEEKISSTLAFNFFMEDAFLELQTFMNCLEEIKKINHSFDINVLLSYGDKAEFDKQGIIKGIPSFLNTIPSYENLFVIIVNLNSQKNMITTASHGKQSPSWLIENEANIFLKHNISSSLPLYLVSQLYRYDFLSDQHLDEYFSRDIPAIKLSFNLNLVKQSSIAALISDSVEYFGKTSHKNWDNHFILINILNTYHRIGEDIIVKIIISIFFSFSLFIFILFFIVSNNRFKSWKIIRKIWYTFPCTILLELLGFWISKNGYNLFAKHFSEIGKIYFLIGSHICFSFMILSIFYVLISIYISDFEERSIDYLIVISTFINQLVFLFIDISLFPIFILIFIVSVFSLKANNKYFHMILFIFIILMFVPYAHKIVTMSEINSLKSFIVTTPHIAIFLALILCPLYLIYFRILTYFKYFLRTNVNIIIFATSYTAFIFILCFSIGTVRSHIINKNTIKNNTSLIKTKKEETIILSYNDKTVFSDIIRTINIKMKESAEYCDVRITSEKGNPILYSDNTYEIINDSTAYFLMPFNPPENLTFNYGANKSPSSITVTALYKAENQNEYWMDRKTIKIK